MSNQHPTQKKNNELLSFEEYIRKNLPNFVVDEFNVEAIRNLSLWACRSEKFNGRQPGWHIDRGLLFFGDVGVGKDEIFRALYGYLLSIGSKYVYDTRVVWQYAGKFQKDGYDAFAEKNSGNRYYEELGLTDENSGQPTKEMVNHFGNKLLIGREIINIRYQFFKNTGYQTHFSTNLSGEALREVYGARSYDRLLEMCNFIHIKGKSRRGVIAPTFLKNSVMPAAPPQRETTDEEHEYNRNIIEEGYQRFMANGKVAAEDVNLFYLMKAYRVVVAEESEMAMYREELAKAYVADPLDRDGAKESRKNQIVAQKSMVMALDMFFQRMKDNGAMSVFGERDVNVEGAVNQMVRKNKTQQLS